MGRGTQTIGTFAFYKCTNLKLLDQSALPASVTKLGVYAFAECSNIQIDISKSSITEIPDYLFYNCDNLHNLTLPQTVTSVGAYAFSECNNLNEVIFDAALTQIRRVHLQNAAICIPSTFRRGDSHREQYLQRLPESEHGRAAGHVEDDR